MKKLIFCATLLLTGCSTTYEVETWLGTAYKYQQITTELTIDELKEAYKGTEADSVRITQGSETRMVYKAPKVRNQSSDTD